MSPSCLNNVQPLASQSPQTSHIKFRETNDSLENNLHDEPEPEVDQLDPEDSDSRMGNSTSPITRAHQKENSSVPLTQTQCLNPSSGPKPSCERQDMVATPQLQAFVLPGNTPRPFPLTPPQPSQILDEPTSRAQTPDGTNDYNSDSDSLPEVADMLARTRPPYSASQVNQRRSITARDDSTRDIKVNVGNTVKKHDTASPRISGSSHKPSYYVVESPEKSVIEIVDSDSGRQYPTQAQSKVPRSGPSSTPLSNIKRRIDTRDAKRKRKHTDLSVQTLVSTQPRPSKRPKIGNGRYRKHQTHWHLDGSVLVQIKSTRFKLQRSRLAQHSEWFKHTFDRIDDGERVAEWDSEANVLYLDQTGVRVEEFVTLLDAMEEGITFVYKTPPFRVMASVLRASSLLSFNEFEKWASQYLGDMWSPNLTDLTTNRIPFATESISLARHCNLLSTLKRAMYELVRLEGFGQTEEAGSDNEQGIGDTETVELSPADFKALVKARERLTSLWLLTATSPKVFPDCSALAMGPDNDPSLNPPNADGLATVAGNATKQPAVAACTSTNRTLSMQAHAKLVIDSGIYEEYHADPVCGFQALIDAPWAEEGFCEACIDTRKKAWASGREKAWENLGLWFGLD